ncbi:hypothetical protein D9M69_444100 [compost metagenome]
MDLLGNVRQLIHVVTDAPDERQVACLGEILKGRGDLLAALHHRRMRPGMPPAELPAGFLLAPNGVSTEQVVQTTAVDAEVYHLAPLEQSVERAWLNSVFPEVGAGPAVRAQRQTNLDVAMLRQKAPERLLSAALGLGILAEQKLFVDRIAKVRIHQRQVLGQQVLLPIHHLRRMLEDHRDEALVFDDPIPHIAGVLELLLEHTSRWLVRLRRQVDDETFRARG